jgi:hypothetical protein
MTTMRRIALLVVLAVLVPAETADAGGWASVELGEAPSGLVAGTPWRVELVVKAHGVTPLAGLHPRIRIANASGQRTFVARPAGRTGHYVATVTFPSAGTWSARIFDGFTDAAPHRIATLTVATPVRPVAAGGRFPWDQTVMIAVVALLFLGGWLAAGDTVPARERRAARGRRRATPRAVA